MSFMFENLQVYQKAVDFYEKVDRLMSEFPKGNYHITNQFSRAALSISLNIAEGNGRFHKKDRQHFFRIARGSAFECVPILEICKRKGFIDTGAHKELKQETEAISKMLTSLADVK